MVVPARHFTPATVEQRDAERSWPTEPELQSCDTVLAVGEVLEPLVVVAEEGEGEETEGGDEEEKERAAACDAGEGPPEVGATRKRVTEKGGSEPTSRAAKRLRRRERREAIKKAEAQKKAEESTGGYCVLARGEHRAEGGVIATGDERTCLADAMSVIWCMLSSCALTQAIGKSTIAWFAARIEGRAADPNEDDAREDPNEDDARAFASERGFSLTYVPNLSSSPRLLLGQRDGVFLVRLLIEYTGADGLVKSDKHFLVYDAANGKILDNLRGMGAIQIYDEDRNDNHTAMRPFYEELFTEAKKIRLVSVCRAA